MNSAPIGLVALFDGNVLDWLLQRPDDLAVVRRALDDGRLRLINTHLFRNEPDATPNPEKRAQLAAVRDQLGGEYVVTPGFVMGVSPFGEAGLFSDDGARRFNEDLTTAENTAEGLETGGRKHAKDALLALTAESERAVLVTCDGGLTKRAKRQGIAVVDPPGLLAMLGVDPS